MTFMMHYGIPWHVQCIVDKRITTMHSKGAGGAKALFRKSLMAECLGWVS